MPNPTGRDMKIYELERCLLGLIESCIMSAKATF